VKGSLKKILLKETKKKGGLRKGKGNKTVEEKGECIFQREKRRTLGRNFDTGKGTKRVTGGGGGP